MKKKYLSILIMILMFLTLSDGIVTGSKTYHPIHVFGVVTLNGEGLENANMTLESQDYSGYYETQTNENGEYEFYVNARDHEDFLVFVDYNNGEHDNQRWFEHKSSQEQYEINFEFEEKESTIITKTMDFFEDFKLRIFNLTLLEWLYLFGIILLLCLILRVLFPRRSRKTSPGMDNDTIILLPSGMNTKVRKF